MINFRGVASEIRSFFTCKSTDLTPNEKTQKKKAQIELVTSIVAIAILFTATVVGTVFCAKGFTHDLKTLQHTLPPKPTGPMYHNDTLTPAWSKYLDHLNEIGQAKMNRVFGIVMVVVFGSFSSLAPLIFTAHARSGLQLIDRNHEKKPLPEENA